MQAVLIVLVASLVLIGCQTAPRTTTEVRSTSSSASAPAPTATQPATPNPVGTPTVQPRVPAPVPVGTALATVLPSPTIPPTIPPTKAPTPSPTVQTTAKVEVKQYQVAKREGGYVEIMGEIVNTGSAPAERIQVAASLLDASGAVIKASGSIYQVRQLQPGDFGPFDVYLSDVPGEWATERIQVQAEPARQPVKQTLEVKSTKAEIDPPSHVHVAGDVVNKGQDQASLVSVLISCFDKDGKIVAVRSVNTELVNIPAGGSAPFDITISNADGAASFLLYVQSI